jgi:hypothetical protein
MLLSKRLFSLTTQKLATVAPKIASMSQSDFAPPNPRLRGSGAISNAHAPAPPTVVSLQDAKHFLTGQLLLRRGLAASPTLAESASCCWHFSFIFAFLFRRSLCSVSLTIVQAPYRCWSICDAFKLTLWINSERIRSAAQALFFSVPFAVSAKKAKTLPPDLLCSSMFAAGPSGYGPYRRFEARHFRHIAG